MWRLLLAVWLGLLAGGARAEQVTVQSGEHDGFTRLVLDFAAPVGWQMTRTTDGYQLALDRPGMRFDVSRVFRKLARGRLSSIWEDPDTGALTLGLGCACHAFPYELRPDILVIDLRDGPAPPGSVFETAEDGRTMPPITARPEVRPRTRPQRPAVAAALAEPESGSPRYDWLEAALSAPDTSAPDPSGPVAEAGTETDGPADLPQVDAGLRDEILRQISNGAARGAVDLAPHAPRPRNGAVGQVPHVPLEQIRIGGDPGVDAAAADRPPNRLTGDGSRCLPDAAVDVGAWGADTPVSETLAARTSILYGEFDRVDQAAAEAAVKYLLHLGFGAEARTLIDTLPVTHPDARLWVALARVVDGDAAPDSPLAGMEVCDGVVALWALLARSDPGLGEKVQTGAVLRAFSALPPHLRRHLGPTLAARFLAQGDAGTVRAIRDAILRPGGDPGPAVRLMEAEMKAAGGDHDPAALVALQSAPGPTAAAATVAAIRAIAAEGGTVDAGLVLATEALLREYKGAEEEAALRYALALALATQGAFDAAFAGLPEDDAGRADLWAMLAERGGDGAVLTHALRGGVAAVPPVPTETGLRMARRLIDLGFPDSALDWLAALPVPGIDDQDSRSLLAAEAELGRRDALAAIGLLAGVAGDEAAALRNAALLQLGTPEPLVRVQSDASAPETLREQAARRARDWPTVATAGPDVWREAAALATAPLAPADLPPLARAEALVAESAKARAALQSLMTATAPLPEVQGDS